MISFLIGIFNILMGLVYAYLTGYLVKSEAPRWKIIFFICGALILCTLGTINLVASGANP